MTEVEDLCEEYLKKHAIRYIRNKKLFFGHVQVGEFDFIIPGAVVEVKTTYTSEYKTAFEKQLKAMKHYIPQDYIIYLYVQHDEKDLLAKDFPDVKVIKEFSEIKCQDYPYYVEDTSIIRSFGSKYSSEYYSKYPEILVLKDNYDRAIVHFTNQEHKKAHRTKFVIVDKKPEKCIFLTKLDFFAFSSNNNIFHNFMKKLQLLNFLTASPNASLKE